MCFYFIVRVYTLLLAPTPNKSNPAPYLQMALLNLLHKAGLLLPFNFLSLVMTILSLPCLILMHDQDPKDAKEKTMTDFKKARNQILHYNQNCKTRHLIDFLPEAMLQKFKMTSRYKKKTSWKKKNTKEVKKKKINRKTTVAYIV